MKKIRQIMGFVIKGGIAIGVLGYLLNKMGLAQLGDTLKSTADNWPWLVAALLLSLIPLLACMARWKMILDAQSMMLGWKRVNTIFFIGLFFNSFMIGPTGGDLIKAYYTARETHHKKTEAVTTILIDRVIGLLVLALVVGIMLLSRWEFFMAAPSTRVFAYPLLVACGLLVGGGVIAFSVHLFKVFPWMRRLNRIPVAGKMMDTVERVYNAFYVCRANPRLLVRLALQSLLIQILFVVVSWGVGKALSIELPFLAYLTFAPMIGLISAIPITPGGIGIREGASIKLWSVMGVTDERAFLLAFIPYIFLVIWGLPGGVMFLFHHPDEATGTLHEDDP